MKNKKLFYGIVAVGIVVIGIGLFILSKPPIAPAQPQKIEHNRRQLLRFQKMRPGGYYGSSTYGQCETDNDCFISGCNFEICQNKTEERLFSICILPPKPTPEQFNYECKCVNRRCEWSK